MSLLPVVMPFSIELYFWVCLPVGFWKTKIHLNVVFLILNKKTNKQTNKQKNIGTKT